MATKAELVRLFGVFLILLLVGRSATTLVAYYPFDGIPFPPHLNEEKIS